MVPPKISERNTLSQCQVTSQKVSNLLTYSCSAFCIKKESSPIFRPVQPFPQVLCYVQVGFIEAHRHKIGIIFSQYFSNLDKHIVKVKSLVAVRADLGTKLGHEQMYSETSR